ncbi:uncharacterized protein TNCV_3262671 [Trichonephila clavipes]|nr:uncharacterized protein TNCV_3262671 [Trichonephila clavipes]
MLYVDDLQVSCQGSAKRLIEGQLQTTVNRLVKGCDQNGHKISPSKSSCVHFCRKRNLHPDPLIHIGNVQIPVVSEVHFLGVMFDCYDKTATADVILSAALFLPSKTISIVQETLGSTDPQQNCIAFILPLPHWAALPVRRHDVRLTRLRIGHTRFTQQAPSVG